MKPEITFQEALAYARQINRVSILSNPQLEYGFCEGSLAQLVSELSIYAPEDVVNRIRKTAQKFKESK